MEGFILLGGGTFAGGLIVGICAIIADKKIKQREAAKLAA